MKRFYFKNNLDEKSLEGSSLSLKSLESLGVEPMSGKKLSVGKLSGRKLSERKFNFSSGFTMLTWKVLIFIWRIPRNLMILIITLYQKTLSPDHGVLKIFFPYGYCKFSPSCSDYSKISIKKRGVIIGLFYSIYRILRCNPWSKGGKDLP